MSSRLFAFAVLLLAVALSGTSPSTAQTSASKASTDPTASPFFPEAFSSDSSAPASSVSSRATGAAPEDASLYYVAGEATMLYNRADSTAPVARLDLRTPVHRDACRDGWCRVRTDGGRDGYVHSTALSNVWIRVSKAERRLYLFRGTRLMKTVKADFGYNSFLDKERRGSREIRDHYRTPEGTFYIVSKNPNSQFYKALVLNYPTREDAARGLRQGLISRPEYRAIVDAQDDHRIPPMNTDLGGWLEIHGDGTGAAADWTQGCVAIHNRDMNAIWWWVKVGTPVLIE